MGEADGVALSMRNEGDPDGVKQGGTAGTSSRPCSLNATGVRAFYSFFGLGDKLSHKKKEWLTEYASKNRPHLHTGLE